MDRRFKDLSPSDLARLPKLTEDHVAIGEEKILMHLYNRRNMHWYLAEYGPISKRFFGFFEDKSSGLFSGYCVIDVILQYSEKGKDGEPLVDEAWSPVIAKEIEKLKAYITMMSCPPDW